MYSHAIPIVGVKFQLDGKTYSYEMNDTITGLTMNRGEEGDTLITGKLVGIHLGRVVTDGNSDHKILDNIPMKDWIAPVCAQIENAADSFEVDEILIETSTVPEDDPEGEPVIGYVAVQTAMILALDDADADVEEGGGDEEEP